jgi:hypothetical protein
VTWTANISIDAGGIALGWRWAAAVYDSFASHTGIDVKPINGPTQNPYPNQDRAGTPENFKSFVVAGGRGTGATNYTGSYTAAKPDTCSISSQRPNALPTTIVKPVKGKLPELTIENLGNEKLEIAAMPNPSNLFLTLP